MSRLYERYCPWCEKPMSARSDYLDAVHDIYQCQECGACWVRITTDIKLATTGTEERAWNRAVKEGYKYIADKEDKT